MRSARGRTVEVQGEILGFHRARPHGRRGAEIVRVSSAPRPGGPATNALIVVQILGSHEKRARYISWIGYRDLEEAQAEEPDVWELVEPPCEYRRFVAWFPFGWPDMQILPNHQKRNRGSIR
jgi:hypothetical protein